MNKLNFQIGMSSGALKSNSTCFFIGYINKHPIALYMTVIRPFPSAVKRVVAVLWRQRIFIDYYIHDFCKFIHIIAAFFYEFVLFSKRLCIKRFKHRLIVNGRYVRGRYVRVIPFYIFKHLFKRAESLCGNFPARNSNTFLNGGNGLGIIKRVPGFRVVFSFILSADRAVMQGAFRSRSESKNCSPCRNFTGYVNGHLPAVSRYLYGLCYCHTSNITQKTA